LVSYEEFSPTEEKGRGGLLLGKGGGFLSKGRERKKKSLAKKKRGAGGGSQRDTSSISVDDSKEIEFRHLEEGDSRAGAHLFGKGKGEEARRLCPDRGGEKKREGEGGAGDPNCIFREEEKKG